MLRVLLIVASTSAFAQSNEVILLGQYGGYDPDVHPGDRLLGVEFYAKVFLSNLVGSNTLTGSFLAQVWYEPSETWSPGICYAVGNESYRAGALADVTTASSWSTSIGGKFRLSESVRLRLSLEHVSRIGAYQLNTVFLAVTYGW